MKYEHRDMFRDDEILHEVRNMRLADGTPVKVRLAYTEEKDHNELAEWEPNKGQEEDVRAGRLVPVRVVVVATDGEGHVADDVCGVYASAAGPTARVQAQWEGMIPAVLKNLLEYRSSDFKARGFA